MSCGSDSFRERNCAPRALPIAMPPKLTIIALAAMAVSTLVALAQEPDRPTEVARIRSVIAKLNKARKNSDAKAFSQLFARDGTIRVGNRIVATGQGEIEKTVTKPLFWSETTAPRIENESIRFGSPDVALVDAIQTQYGPVIVKQSVPVTVLLKLDGQEWRIASLWLHPGADVPGALIRSHFAVE
jgi:uncharacterized protein (TIGR02246 family)